MKNITIVGAQWGDEGKGKIVDHICGKFDVVLRFQGGHNAGHTIVIGNDKFILSILPSGLIRNKLCIIGSNVVQMIGYTKKTYKDIQVMMDQTVWLNPVLPVAYVEGEEVEVMGTRPLVERGATAKKITVGKEAIQSLPIRDMSELYSLQSGVVKVESKTRGIPNQEERGLEEVHVRGWSALKHTGSSIVWSDIDS